MTVRGWWRLAAVLAMIGLGAVVVRVTSPTGSEGATAIAHGPSGVNVLAAGSVAPAIAAMAPTDHVVSGSADALVAQVVEGATDEVLVAADPAGMGMLRAHGLVLTPVPVARDTLVVVTPAANPARIRSLADLADPGVRLALAASTTPLGRDARRTLDRLGLARVVGDTLLQAPDEASVASDLLLGEADAGILYASQAHALGARVHVVPIPAAAQPTIVVQAAVLVHAADPGLASAFLAYLRGPDGQAYLHAYGFATP